jgi:murein DD-endopeptidase MepM/ murein hydrolase activator NlpD
MAKTRTLVVGVLVGLALLGLLAGFALPVARAASTTDQLALNKERLAHMRDLIEQAKAKEAVLNAEVDSYDAKLNAIGGELAQLQAKIDVVEARLAKTEVRLAKLRARLRAKIGELHLAEARLAWQQAVFERRIAQTYKNGDIGYLDVLLGSADLQDLISRVEFVRQLVGSDNALVGRLTAARAQVAAQKKAIAVTTAARAAAEARLKDQNAELAALKVKVVARQQGVQAARQIKAGALAQVAKTRKGYEQQEAQLLAESRQLQAIISGAGSTGHGTGSMMWPVNGPVTSGFGWRVHPVFHVRKFHTGIDIAAAYGTAIHAADSGVVIFASTMTGYGNVIIIDHGKGISTLYAHQRNFAVGDGATVGKGRVIGYVGTTGYSTGPHLHFEVRVDGNPVDPLRYL